MKQFLIFFCLFYSLSITGQTSTSEEGNRDQWISTIDFVEILNGYEKETLYYYDHNWKVLRKMALSKKYIENYQLLKAPVSEDNSIAIILITTYSDQEQYNNREAHFEELIKEKGALKLMNDIKPKDFRKIVFSKEEVKQHN